MAVTWPSVLVVTLSTAVNVPANAGEAELVASVLVTASWLTVNSCPLTVTPNNVPPTTVAPAAESQAEPFQTNADFNISL
jgi:hypothetical protein